MCRAKLLLLLLRNINHCLKLKKERFLTLFDLYLFATL